MFLSNKEIKDAVEKNFKLLIQKKAAESTRKIKKLNFEEIKSFQQFKKILDSNLKESSPVNLRSKFKDENIQINSRSIVTAKPQNQKIKLKPFRIKNNRNKINLVALKAGSSVERINNQSCRILSYKKEITELKRNSFNFAEGLCRTEKRFNKSLNNFYQPSPVKMILRDKIIFNVQEQINYQKIFVTLFELRKQVERDRSSSYQILSHFLTSNILYGYIISKDIIEKLYFLLLSDFMKKINPKKNLRENLIEILLGRKQEYRKKRINSCISFSHR